MNQKFLNFTVLVLLSTFTLAASVPNSFTAGTPAVAADVNANFAALVSAINSLESSTASLDSRVDQLEAQQTTNTNNISLLGTRVNLLEGQNLSTASVVGTYRNLALAFRLTGNETTGDFKLLSLGFKGTATLNADGTCTTTESEAPETELVYTPTLTMTNTNTPENGACSWTFSDNVLALDFGDGVDTYVHAAAGRLFISTENDYEVSGQEERGEQGIRFLMRSNI